MKKVIDFMHKNQIFTVIVVIWAVVLFFLLIMLAFNLFFNFAWEALLTIATWVLAGGVVAAFWQIGEARKSTNAQIAMDLFRELRSDRALEILRFIYSLKSDDDFNKLCSTDLHSIEYILDRFEVLGNLVELTIVDKRIAIDAYGGAAALRCWYILHKYIKSKNDKYGPYKINYESFARHSLEYFRDRNFPVIFNSDDIIKIIWDSDFKPRTREEIEQELKRNQKSN